MLASLGCDGIWDESVARTNPEEFQGLIDSLDGVHESPEKAQVRNLLEQGYLDASPGNFGIVESSTFAVEVQDVISDREISSLEDIRLQDSHDSMANDRPCWDQIGRAHV